MTLAEQDSIAERDRVHAIKALKDIRALLPEEPILPVVKQIKTIIDDVLKNVGIATPQSEWIKRER